MLLQRLRSSFNRYIAVIDQKQHSVCEFIVAEWSGLIEQKV